MRGVGVDTLKPLPLRRCRRCGGTYSEAFFRAWGDNGRCHQRVRPVCIGCELTARTERKRRNRSLEKARRTLYHHADKYIRLGVATSRDDFAERFGWDVRDMAHDIDHATANGCPYCRRPFAEMEHGLADCTLDVIHPDQLPYYRSNARWCCQTCNNEKRRTAPEQWGAKLRDWEQWREWTSHEWPPDSLFAELN